MLTELRIGSNKDEVEVVVDTGSSILWVMDSNVECKTSPLNGEVPNCKIGGTLSPEKSKTFNTTGVSFETPYMDKESVLVNAGCDVISFGKDKDVKGFNFGVANETTSKFGILGISFPIANLTGWYLPVELKNQGITNRSAYSIFLNEANKTGSVLFGAVDHSKYLGDLQTVPIVYDETEPHIRVNVSGIDININDAKVSGNISESAFLLDTGTAVSRFPTSFLDTLLEQIEGAKYSDSKISFPDCSQLESLKFEIKFDGKTITVPVENLNPRTNHNNCSFYINFEDDDDELILGMDVLRSIYFVVDLDDKEVSLAQSDFSQGKQDIEAFPSPDVNRNLASRGRSEQKVSSASSIVSSIDVWLYSAILLTWSL